MALMCAFRASRALWLSLPLAALCASGCAPPEVTFRLRFPSEETFLMSNTARVEIYDGSGTEEESPDAICRALSIGHPAPLATLHSSGVRDVCEFNSGLVLKDVGTGRRVFAASAADAGETTILRGCAVLDVTPDREVIEIQLSTLPTYPDAPTPACPNLQRKCEARDCDS